MTASTHRRAATMAGVPRSRLLRVDLGHAADEALELLDRLGLRERAITPTVTIASATKATIAPQNAAAWSDPRSIVPLVAR